MNRLLLRCCLAASTVLFVAAASVSPLPAQLTQRTIAEYNVNDATLRVSLSHGRIEVFVWQGQYALAIYLDQRSVAHWTDSTDRILALPNKTPKRETAEHETRILRNTDPSFRSGLVLTRKFEGRKSRCFVTAWVGDHRHVMIPMRDSQARAFVAALRRASQEAYKTRI